jgi:hypothetical protein
MDYSNIFSYMQAEVTLIAVIVVSVFHYARRPGFFS